jgi:cellulose synthase/poly-beta-1,6-N-acetylglucosamine synthase-like glycosyltransferase
MIAALALFLSLYLTILTLGEWYLVGIHLLRSRAALRREWDELSGECGISPPFPLVCVQLAVHNEPAVIEDTIDSLCSLDWPKDRFEVLVLDDSDDETFSLAEERSAVWRAQGISVRVVHRSHRREYKAGALQEGLQQTAAQYIAIFDADYRPNPQFLRQVMPVLLADPKAAFVQARLEHRNRGASWLTRAQALELDTHLAYEQAAKNWAGLPTMFHGTCGIWRREAIDQAGGWSGRSLTEDQDLSFRVFALGWRSRFLCSVGVPGELPDSIAALMVQRHRWGTGTAQVLRRLPFPMLRTLNISRRMAFLLQSMFTASAPLLVVLLTLTVLLAWVLEPSSLAIWALAVPLVSLVAAKSAGTSLATLIVQRPLDRGYIGDVILMWVLHFLLLPIGSISFLRGLFSQHNRFVRTAKTGS